jgi:hypothetical protein
MKEGKSCEWLKKRHKRHRVTRGPGELGSFINLKVLMCFLIIYTGSEGDVLSKTKPELDAP